MTDTGRALLAHDLDLERDVLRWALEYERIAPVEVGAFFRDVHREIWAAVLEAQRLGQSPAYPIVRGILTERNQLDSVGAGYLLELARDGVPASEHIRESAVARLRELARERQARIVLSRGLSSDEPINIPNLIERLGVLVDDGRHARDGDALVDDVAVLNSPEIDYLCAPVLPMRSLVAGIGEPGIGKSYVFSIDLALSVASGRPFLGLPILHKGPVVVVAAEGAQCGRIGAWKIAHGYDLDVVLGVHVRQSALQLLDAAAVERFIADAKPIRPVLVVLDTFARCLVGGDENSARDVGLAIAAADRIRVALDCTVLIVHHTNKAGTSERGSGALRGACDAMFQLTKADDLIRLECSKMKDAEPFEPFDLRLVPAFEGAKYCVVRPAGDVRQSDELTDAQGKALHALRELFGVTGATSQEWIDVVPAMHKATFYRARAVLLEHGYVRHDTNAKRFYHTAKTVVASSRTAVARVFDAPVASVAEAVA